MTTRQKAILGLVGVFVAGGIIGAAIVGLVVRGNVQSARSLREREGFLRFVEHRLELTESQRDSLADELDSLYANLANLRKSASNELAELLDSFRVHVEPQLTPHQRELLKRQEEFMRHGLPPAQGPRGLPYPGRGRPPIDGPPAPADAPPFRLDDVPGSMLDSGGGIVAPRKPNRPDTGASLQARPRQSESGQANSDADPALEGIRRFQTKMEWLRNQVHLTPEQDDEVRMIVDDAIRGAKSLRDEHAGQPRLLRWALHRLMVDARRRVFEVLTPDQRMTMRESRRGKVTED